MLQCVVYYIVLWCDQLEGPELCHSVLSIILYCGVIS